MHLGVEILAARATTLRLAHFFETWLAVPGGCLRRSHGRDEYHLGVKIAPDQRLAATGRTFLCQADTEELGFGPNQARPASLSMYDPHAGPLYLGMRTNVFLDLKDLRQGAKLRLLADDRRIPLDLTDTPLWAQQLLPGRFLLDITPAL